MKCSDHFLRPATLQPPKIQRCEKVKLTFGHGALESCKTKEIAKYKARKPLMVGLISLSCTSLSRFLWAPHPQIGVS